MADQDGGHTPAARMSKEAGMRALPMVTITTLSIILPIAVAAQAPQKGGTATRVAEKQTTTSQTQTTTSTPSVTTPNPDSHWMVSGFGGANFGNNAETASSAFGGSVGYLWKGRWGSEFNAGFTPNFDLQNNFLGLGVTPWINSYMGNAVYAVPVGEGAKWQPFVSGGVGAISLRSQVSDSSGNLFNTNATRFGGNVGGGLMAFMGNVGFRADVQYLRAAGSYSIAGAQPTGTTPAPSATTPTPGATPTPAPTPSPGPGPFPYSVRSIARDGGTNAIDDPRASAFADNVLSGLHFWRANIGLALRW